MSRNGLEGRQRGSILVQLAATAGVLVLPPLMMSAGVTLFGAQTEDRLQVAADRTVASAISKSSALIAMSPRPRDIPKSADRPPLHDEPAAKAALPPAPVVETVIETVVEADDSPATTEDNAAAEPVPFLGPVPVTLVVVRKEPEPEPDPPEEEPAPAAPAPVASIAPVIIPRDAPKAPSIRVPHPRVKAEREQARPAHRIAEKRPHAPAPRAAGGASHRATASAASKAKPKSGLQRRADLEN
jgi:protein TonB